MGSFIAFQVTGDFIEQIPGSADMAEFQMGISQHQQNIAAVILEIRRGEEPGPGKVRNGFIVAAGGQSQFTEPVKDSCCGPWDTGSGPPLGKRFARTG